MQITIPKRFCGPPTSGNGGYTCGRVAAFIGDVAEITLRAPPPLDTPLDVLRDGEVVRVQHGAQVVAEGRPATLSLQIPEPPSWEEALAGATRYNGRLDHAYGTCFVCGPRASAGMHISPGPTRDGLVAGTWVPDASLAGADGLIASEFLWAAIDCPGSWSVIGRRDADAPLKEIPSSLLLGRLTGQVLRRLEIGEECTALGWFLGAQGRKYDVGTAIHTRGGQLVAASRATWIAPK
ncbi:MAG TPA: hypothetical protein VM240_08615 [Verrucomicrobiae bacterium]|nr:hypothetical protein [Verrucomicrobiae bacterium]